MAFATNNLSPNNCDNNFKPIYIPTDKNTSNLSDRDKVTIALLFKESGFNPVGTEFVIKDVDTVTVKSTKTEKYPCFNKRSWLSCHFRRKIQD